jgi:alkyl sulfatase BDS1-like metallo-beta-lactamase superfamily hydrolase
LGVALAARKYPYAETIRSLPCSGYGYQAITAGQLKLERRREAAGELSGVFETFPFWFNIVTP